MAAHVAAFAETSASGVDRTVVGLVTHLERFGVLPEVWELNPHHARISERRAGSVKVVELPSRDRTLGSVLGLPAATRRFIRRRSVEVDLVHFHSVFIPDNVHVARTVGCPYVITPNGGYSPAVLRRRNRTAKRLWMRMRERTYVRAASLIHAVSPRERDQLRETFGLVPLEFMPNAVDILPTFVASDQRKHLPRKRIVFLGRLAVDHKGLDLLIEGYARHVKRTSDASSELVIAGPDFRDGRRELHSLAASLLPEAQVSFPGPLFGGDKEALLSSAYAFVHTSRWEGMPYSVLEALASGCPVLLTPATNLGEFVEDYGAGVVVDGIAETIGEGLTALLRTSPQRYDAMCSAARRLVSEHFTWPVVAEQMSSAYRRILG